MLAVPRAAYDAMVDHALEGAPEEVCGVLGGTFDERRSRVAAVERATNVAPAPGYEYAIDPAEQLELMDGLEARGHHVVGFYHSHPAGPAGPSGTDVTRATWPDRSYLIVDLAGAHPAVGAWRWDGDGGRSSARCWRSVEGRPGLRPFGPSLARRSDGRPEDRVRRRRPSPTAVITPVARLPALGKTQKTYAIRIMTAD